MSGMSLLQQRLVASGEQPGQASPNPTPQPTMSPAASQVSSGGQSLLQQRLLASGEQPAGSQQTSSEKLAAAGITQPNMSPGMSFVAGTYTGIGQIGNKINKLVLPDSYNSAIKAYGDDLDLQQQIAGKDNPFSAAAGNFAGQTTASTIFSSAVAAPLGAFGGVTNGFLRSGAVGAGNATMGLLSKDDSQSNLSAAVSGVVVGGLAGAAGSAVGKLKGVFSDYLQSKSNIPIGRAIEGMDGNQLVNSVISNTFKSDGNSFASASEQAKSLYDKILQSAESTSTDLYNQFKAASADVPISKGNIQNQLLKIQGDQVGAYSDANATAITQLQHILNDNPTYSAIQALNKMKDLGEQSFKAQLTGDYNLSSMLKTAQSGIKQDLLDSTAGTGASTFLQQANNHFANVVAPLRDVAGISDKLTDVQFVSNVINNVRKDATLVKGWDQFTPQLQGQLQGALAQNLKEASDSADGSFNFNKFANNLNNQIKGNKISPVLQPVADKINSLASIFADLGQANKVLKSGGSAIGNTVSHVVGMGIGGAAGAVVGEPALGVVLGNQLSPKIAKQFTLNAAGRILNTPAGLELLNQYTNLSKAGGNSIILKALQSNISKGLSSAISDSIGGLTKWGLISGANKYANPTSIGLIPGQTQEQPINPSTVGSLGARD